MKGMDRGVLEYRVRWRFGWMIMDCYIPLEVDIPLSIENSQNVQKQGGKHEG